MSLKVAMAVVDGKQRQGSNGLRVGCRVVLSDQILCRAEQFRFGNSGSTGNLDRAHRHRDAADAEVETDVLSERTARETTDRAADSIRLQHRVERVGDFLRCRSALGDGAVIERHSSAQGTVEFIRCEPNEVIECGRQAIFRFGHLKLDGELGAVRRIAIRDSVERARLRQAVGRGLKLIRRDGRADLQLAGKRRLLFGVVLEAGEFDGRQREMRLLRPNARGEHGKDEEYIEDVWSGAKTNSHAAQFISAVLN